MYALLQVRVGVRVGVSKEVLVVGPIKLKGKGHDVVLPVLGALVVKHVLLWNASPGSQAKGAPVRHKFQSAVRLCVAGAVSYHSGRSRLRTIGLMPSLYNDLDLLKLVMCIRMRKSAKGMLETEK